MFSLSDFPDLRNVYYVEKSPRDKFIDDSILEIVKYNKLTPREKLRLYLGELYDELCHADNEYVDWINGAEIEAIKKNPVS